MAFARPYWCVSHIVYGKQHHIFNEGMRNIGLIVLADVMAACADQYVVMMNESKEDTRTNG